MINVIAHDVLDEIELPYRTEDVRFSPSGRLLAVAATDGCIILYAVDVSVRPIHLAASVELRSPALLVPHGVEFLSEELLVVANRNANLAFFRIPPPDQWHGPCVLAPLLEVRSALFGATGVTRKLRDRDLFCGPGSVRLFDGVLYVSCNYRNTVSTFACQVEHGEIKVREGVVVAHEGLEVVDGVALSEDGALMALSDHDHHRVAVYRRVDYLSKESPRYELSCSLTDIDLRYAHGLRFDRGARRLYAADAGGRFIHVFASTDGWRTDAATSTFKTQGVEEEAFIKSREAVPLGHRTLEGGAKGIDIAPDGKVIALTCRNQVLRFLEIQDGDQTQRANRPALNSLAVGAEVEVALSCLVDDTPAIWASLVPWLATATMLAGIAPGNIHIHHVCPLRMEIAQLCSKLGVRTHRVDRFDAGNPYTNKIMQGMTHFGGVNNVLLMDVDTVFTALPPFSEMRGLVAGKPVDVPNPPLATLRRVFDAAGIDILGVCTNQYLDNGMEVSFETLIGNFNGGLYIIPPPVLMRLAQRWSFWTRWLLDNISLMEDWAKHADQVGFALALSELRLPLRILDNSWNYPAHLALRNRFVAPWILHHHARFDNDGQLLPVASPAVQNVVHKVNSVIRKFKELHAL